MLGHPASITLGMAWTSDWHQLLWTSIELPKDGSVLSTYNYGWWFWVLGALSTTS